jgi:hypothetical protein
MIEDVFTDVGGLSLFAALELDSADEVLNDIPLMNIVWYKELPRLPAAWSLTVVARLCS